MSHRGRRRCEELTTEVFQVPRAPGTGAHELHSYLASHVCQQDGGGGDEDEPCSGQVLAVDGAEANYWGDGVPGTGFAIDDLADRSGNGYNLTADGTTRYTRLYALPLNDADSYLGGAYKFDGNQGLYYDDSGAGALRYLDTVTLQALVYHKLDGNDQGFVISYGGDGTSGVAHNRLYSLRVNQLPGGTDDAADQVSMEWQDGTNNTISYAAPITVENREWMLITAVREDEGGTVSVKLYANEYLIGSVSGLNKPTGGTNQILSIGRVFGAAIGAEPWFEGGVGQVRIWNAARSPADIAADTLRVLPLMVD
jgi:hypothetical protein